MTTTYYKPQGNITVSAGTSGSYYINNPAVTLQSSTTNAIWTTPGMNGSWGAVSGNSPNTGKLMITGENADIDLNGKSLKKWMEAVEARLAILQPNIKLEEEWEELKSLGEQYRALEKEIQEKMKTWDILKKE